MAFAILSVISLGIFRVFRSGNRQASQAAWTSAAQKELRNSLKRVHDELSRASFYTELRRSEVIFLDPATGAAHSGGAAAAAAGEDSDETNFKADFDVIVDGTPATPREVTEDGTRQEILKFYQCSPKDSAGGVNGWSAACLFFLEGGSLYFQRDRLHDPDSAVIEVLKQIATNVESIRTWVEDKADSADPLEGSAVSVEITLHHPNRGIFPNTRVTQAITARVPVGHRNF